MTLTQTRTTPVPVPDATIVMTHGPVPPPTSVVIVGLAPVAGTVQREGVLLELAKVTVAFGSAVKTVLTGCGLPRTTVAAVGLTVIDVSAFGATPRALTFTETLWEIAGLACDLAVMVAVPAALP